MSTNLDLTQFIEAAHSVKPHTSKDVFFHLAEEVGEVSVNLNRPHKASEPLVGELADVMNCVLDIYFLEYGSDFTLLQEAINKKCAKWRIVQGAS
jgi:NTP pyrophosphatase (non-canonical NTP hydrolase)